MAICPLCNKGTLKVGDSNVYCSEKSYNSITKQNNGCDFHIFYDQKKGFGEVLDPKSIKAIVEGQTLTSKRGRTIVLDLKEKHYVKTTKPEDGDL